MSDKEKPVGALWKKEGQYGHYYSGEIEINGEKIRIVCFANQHKKESKHPDYKIYISKPKEMMTVQEIQRTLPKKSWTPPPSNVMDSEDIPF